MPKSKEPRILGLVANDPRLKGLDRALAVLARLRDTQDNVELWIIGRDPGEEFLPIVNTPGVRWLGRVPRQVLLDEVLPAIDIMLHPTRFDGLPLSVLEAMAAGVPVVASAYRALPEVIGAGGLTAGDVPSMVAAVLLLLDPSANRTAGALGRQRQRQLYSPQAALPPLLRAYEQAVGPN